MRRRVMAAVMAAALGGLGLLGAQPVGACTAPPGPGPTEQELVAEADLVFEGVAVSRHDPNAGALMQSSGDPIVWTFTVDRQVKGTASQPQEVTSARSGATCGVVFEIGTRYRVFADVVDGRFWTSLGSGTREATVESSTTTTSTPPPTTTTSVPPAPPTRTGRIALTG